MIAAYQHLAVAQLRPGMVLSDELRDRQGDMVLPKGAALTAHDIAQLAAQGIETVTVLGSTAAGPGADAPGRDAIESRLGRLFRHNDPNNDADWATGVLRGYITDYRLGREIRQ